MNRPLSLSLAAAVILSPGMLPAQFTGEPQVAPEPQVPSTPQQVPSTPQPVPFPGANPIAPTNPSVPVPPTAPGTPGSGINPAPGFNPAPPVRQLPTVTIDERLDRQFVLAQRTLESGRHADAAAGLIKAAAMAEASGDPTEAMLAGGVAALRVIAFDTSCLLVGDPTRYNRAFAATHIALANATFRESNGAWVERRVRTAAEKLAATGYHLNRAITWGGRTPSPAGRQTLATAERVSGQLLASETIPVSPASVNDVYNQLGAMLPAIGQTLAADRDRADDEDDDRIRDTAKRAIDGIRSGRRKPADTVAAPTADYGTFIQQQQNQR